MIRNPRLHRRGNAQTLMNPAEIVVHVVKGDRGNVVFDLLREGIGKPGEAAHLHPHGEVLPLDVAGADMLRVRVPDLGFLFASHAFSRRIANLGGFAGTAAVELHQDGVINVSLEGRIDGGEVKSVAIRGQLNSVGADSGEADH